MAIEATVRINVPKLAEFYKTDEDTINRTQKIAQKFLPEWGELFDFENIVQPMKNTFYICREVERGLKADFAAKTSRFVFLWLSFGGKIIQGLNSVSQGENGIPPAPEATTSWKDAVRQMINSRESVLLSLLTHLAMYRINVVSSGTQKFSNIHNGVKQFLQSEPLVEHKQSSTQEQVNQQRQTARDNTPSPKSSFEEMLERIASSFLNTVKEDPSPDAAHRIGEELTGFFCEFPPEEENISEPPQTDNSVLPADSATSPPAVGPAPSQQSSSSRPPEQGDSSAMPPPDKG